MPLNEQPKATIFMRIVSTLLLAALGMSAAALPAQAGPREREQAAAFRGTQEGRFIRLPVIEARIVPAMRGYRYLGPELDVAAGRYRLKFLKGPQLVWIDVDARTGQILAKVGF